jgi:hypothetical protein
MKGWKFAWIVPPFELIIDSSGLPLKPIKTSILSWACAMFGAITPSKINVNTDTTSIVFGTKLVGNK